MPATTPRGYPYSIPTDPADVPTAIEDLAEAIDVDVQARADSIHARPAFRIMGTEPVTYFPQLPFAQNYRQPFNLQEAIVGGAIAQSSGSVQQIIPQLPGFWWFHGTIIIPRAGSAGIMQTVGITLQTGAGVLARNSSHIMPPESDGTNAISVSTGAFFNGTTDYIEMLGTARVITSTTGVPQMVVRRRYLVGMRMTES